MLLAITFHGGLWAIIGQLLLGGLIGWVASIFFGSKGGLIKYIIIGVLGSFVGSFIASLFGFQSGGALISFGFSVLGAGVLIIVLRFFKLIKWIYFFKYLINYENFS